MTDDDISEYLDPELDGHVAVNHSGDDHWLRGSPGLPHLVVVVHTLAAMVLLPSAWLTYESGDQTQALVTAALAVGTLVAGVVFARFVASRR